MKLKWTVDKEFTFEPWSVGIWENKTYRYGTAWMPMWLIDFFQKVNGR